MVCHSKRNGTAPFPTVLLNPHTFEVQVGPAFLIRKARRRYPPQSAPSCPVQMGTFRFLSIEENLDQGVVDGSDSPSPRRGEGGPSGPGEGAFTQRLWDSRWTMISLQLVGTVHSARGSKTSL